MYFLALPPPFPSYDSENLRSNIMERHVQRTQVPTIFIFSEVSEGKHRPEDLERLMNPHVLYSPSVQILQINPTTKSQMKRGLLSIAKAEGFDRGLTSDFYEEIHCRSGGDLRHAILDLQFRYGCHARFATIGVPGKRSRHSIENDDGMSARKDAKLSTFHALGKLLYAKRKQRQPPWRAVALDYDDSEPPSKVAASTPPLTLWDDGRGPLEFVPEEVLSRIDMGIDSAMTFLAFHSPDFFTDITELSQFYDLMSDSDTFVHQLFDGRQRNDGPFPMHYAASIGGRAVAHANVHPAPPKFRQFSAPKVYGVMKKKRENETKIEHLRRRLSTVGRGCFGGADDRGTTSIRGNIGSANQFVTESLPYFRIVIPQGTDALCYVQI